MEPDSRRLMPWGTSRRRVIRALDQSMDVALNTRENPIMPGFMINSSRDFERVSTTPRLKTCELLEDVVRSDES